MSRNGRVKPDAAVETVPLTDGEKLTWERFARPAALAIQAQQAALATAQELLVRQMMAARGMAPEDGWKLNPEQGRYERGQA